MTLNNNNNNNPDIDYLPDSEFDLGDLTGETEENVVIDLDDDTPTTDKRIKPIASFGGSVFLVLSLATFVFLIWQVVKPKQEVVVKEELPTFESLQEEEEDLGAKIALVNQKYELNQSRENNVQPDELPPPTEPKPIAQPPAPTTVRTTSAPTPRPAPTPTRRNTTPPKPVNPYQQWEAISSSFGISAGSSQTEALTNATPIARARVNPELRNDSQPSLPFRPGQPTPETSLGTQGILARRKIEPPAEPTLTVAELGRGGFKAKIVSPVVWDTALAPDDQQTNLILLKISQDILDNRGEILIPQTAELTATIEGIDEGTGLVRAYISSYQFIDNDGSLKQVSLPPNKLILRKGNKNALLAKSTRQSKFKDSLAITGVSIANKVGGALIDSSNRGSTTVTNGNIITSVNNNSNNLERDIAGAVLEGATEPVLGELQDRRRNNVQLKPSSIFTLKEQTVFVFIPEELNLSY